MATSKSSTAKATAHFIESLGSLLFEIDEIKCNNFIDETKLITLAAEANQEQLLDKLINLRKYPRNHQMLLSGIKHAIDFGYINCFKHIIKEIDLEKLDCNDSLFLYLHMRTSDIPEDESMFKILLQNKSDQNANINGYTAAHYAVENLRCDALKRLYENPMTSHLLDFSHQKKPTPLVVLVNTWINSITDTKYNKPLSFNKIKVCAEILNSSKCNKGPALAIVNNFSPHGTVSHAHTEKEQLIACLT